MCYTVQTNKVLNIFNKQLNFTTSHLKIKNVPFIYCIFLGVSADIQNLKCPLKFASSAVKFKPSVGFPDTNFKFT